MYTRLQISLLSVLGAALCVATVASAQTVQLQAQHPTPLSAPVVSSPANLEQLPPSAPTVTYENGLLTISAYNSTLSDILRGISNQTGADVEIPPQAEERVVTHLGPGPARDVLRSLLAGSQFNYVIVGSAADPNALVRVLLTPRPANTDKLSAQNVVPPAGTPAQSRATSSPTACSNQTIRKSLHCRCELSNRCCSSVNKW